MTSPSPSSAPQQRSNHNWGLWFLLAVLAGVAGYGLLHESRKRPGPAVSEPAVSMGQQPTGTQEHSIHGMGQVERPPMSPDEERYAQSLWPIHDSVRTAALKMTFSGLAYKMGDTDKAGMREKVAPLATVFSQAREKTAALKVPASMRGVQADYLEAVRLYKLAVAAMVKPSGDDQHLLEAHAHSEKASTLLLKVGDVLWPGEHKPN